MKIIQTIIAYLFTFILVAPGLYFFFNSTYHFGKAIQASSWKTTEATVEEIYLDEIKVRRRYGFGYDRETVVQYTFQVNKQNYTGNTISFGYGSTGSDKLDRHTIIYEKLNTAKTIQIWYNPQNPNESVITKGTNNYMINMFLLSLCWNGLGLPMLYFVLTNKGK